ncbi:phage terminase large subunit [Cellulophaga phage phi19:1]|uniref:Phage terminase large subunit n=1 Tax=Cellulophaga phage phi19:1 TaxID=1327970 RepID=R9ZW81_9CAUD|nr:terminase large subunit [Cellulophaga phage phi19:1]AGO47356.1 phage terminase large subunit [Cellulophaga phage phi19:1]
MELQVSPVFEKNWNAIHARDENGKRVHKVFVNEGSSRSSKTWSFFQILYLYCISNKRKRVMVLRETAVDCRENVETEFIDWMKDPLSRIKSFEKGEITGEQLDKFLREEDLTRNVLENKSKHHHTFHQSQSRIVFSGADSVEKIIGKGNDVIWVNEPYKFPEEVMNQLIQRCKDFVLLDWNPKQNHYIDKMKLRSNVIVIHSTFRDNPFCPEEQKQHILSYLPLSNKFIDCKELDLESLIGTPHDDLEKFLDSKGIKGRIKSDILLANKNEKESTASEYHWSVYGEGKKSEKPNKIFNNWKQIHSTEWLALPYDVFYGMDFGQTNATALGAVKYNDGTFYFHELLYKPERKMNKGLVYELERVGVDKARPLVCDSASPEKILELRRAGFNAMPAFKNAGSVFSGISFMQRAKICYTNTSINLINEYDEYEWDTDRLGLIDKPIKVDDHILDAIRYCCSYLGVKLKIVL